MTVLLSYIFLSALVGILMRQRPFYQTQLVVMVMTTVVMVCYFFFGML